MKAKAEKLVASGRVWRKVSAPKKWHPAEGEVIEGEFQGRQHKDGRYGPYQVMIIKATDGTVRTLSGAVINSLLDGACLKPGALVRVVFLGDRVNALGTQSYKDFDLYVAEEPK